MTEPTDPAAGGPTPKGSAPAPGYGASGNSPSSDATTPMPTANAHRAEGGAGGVSKAYSGGAAG